MRADVEFTDKTAQLAGKLGTSCETIEALAGEVLAKAEGMLPPLPPQYVYIYITDDEEIHGINRDERGVDRATDVLSFPMLEHRNGEGPVEETDFDPETGLLPMGDIVVSLERAQAQGEEYGHGLKRELAFLICHGYLHLRGFDHMTPEDEAVMMPLTEEILKGIATR